MCKVTIHSTKRNYSEIGYIPYNGPPLLITHATPAQLPLFNDNNHNSNLGVQILALGARNTYLLGRQPNTTREISHKNQPNHEIQLNHSSIEKINAQINTHVPIHKQIPILDY